MKSKIYKIINDINDKVYVGKTTNSLDIRFKQHLADATRREKEKRPLYNAINKYGAEHFSIELIEECDTQIENEREQFWIGFYKGYEEGYNATRGGEGKCLYSHDKILSLLEQGKTTKEIIEEIGCCKDVIVNVAHSCGLSLNIPKNDLTLQMEQSKKRVICLDKETLQEVNYFESYADAARWLLEEGHANGNTSGIRTHIGEVCKGKRKSAYGFKWVYQE